MSRSGSRHDSVPSQCTNDIVEFAALRFAQRAEECPKKSLPLNDCTSCFLSASGMMSRFLDKRWRSCWLLWIPFQLNCIYTKPTSKNSWILSVSWQFRHPLHHPALPVKSSSCISSVSWSCLAARASPNNSYSLASVLQRVLNSAKARVGDLRKVWLRISRMRPQIAVNMP